MKFLPTEDITYKTNLKEDEVLKRLIDSIDTERAARFGLFNDRSVNSYEGEIDGQTFHIKRIINYRNSFLPQIGGVIKQHSHGTIIKVEMRLHVSVGIFLGIWCLIAGIACIASLWQVIGHSEFSLKSLAPLGMLLFGYVLTATSFKAESIKSKKDLQAIFEAEIVGE